MPDPDRLITSLDVREYFQSAVTAALTRQSVATRDETAIYLANLLTTFVRAEALYGPAGSRGGIPPLAEIYGSAVGARSYDDRRRNLQQLGDIALFISGLFSSSLKRSLVDVDYYIAMGGGAYGQLASTHGRPLSEVFGELATRFPEFVDVLAEVGDNSNLNTSEDVLRLYEIWQSTGSRRAADKLRGLGIVPVATHRRAH